MLMTPGDVGRPRTWMEARFGPALPPGAFGSDRLVVQMKEEWWYAGGAEYGFANNCGAREMRKSEPRGVVDTRVREFRQWALDQPEAVVVVVGHSCFISKLIKHIGGEPTTLKNADYTKVYI